MTRARLVFFLNICIRASSFKVDNRLFFFWHNYFPLFILSIYFSLLSPQTKFIRTPTNQRTRALKVIMSCRPPLFFFFKEQKKSQAMDWVGNSVLAVNRILETGSTHNSPKTASLTVSHGL